MKHVYNKLIIFETGEIFNSVKELSEYFNVSSRYIYECINNKNKSVLGKHICTDLSIFNNNKLIYTKSTCIIKCIELDMEFISIRDAARYFKVDHKSIQKVLDLPNRTCKKYHWKKIEDKKLKSFLNGNVIYCYETKEKFNSITLAVDKYNSSVVSSVDNPNKTSCGYHFCTNLSIFDNIELSYGCSKEVYCYETKQKFNSITDAENFIGFSGITLALDLPHKSVGKFHWCTNLSIFNNIDLTNSGGKVIYCFETKEKFNSVIDANNKYCIQGHSLINECLNNPNATAAGYHWCTDLSIFDGIELTKYTNSVSSYEREIVEYIKFLGISNIIQSDRKILSGKELDIYLPDYNLAIEFNGNYWHSTEFKSVNYHQDKTLKCLELGINLISIFEFDWNINKHIYKNLIKTKLGKLENTIYARKCQIKEISQLEFSNFLIKYHLQGDVKTKIRLGLFHNSELVSVMGFNKSKENYILNRLCIKHNHNVVGGASKLLNYFERNYNYNSIISYADLKHSNGKIYEILGFKKSHINRPIYIHLKNTEILERYKTSHKELRKKENFIYDENLTEFQNMDNNKYIRIWTVGTITYLRNKIETKN